jgi:sodium-coupled neutral amino acid transporter 7/8
LPLLVGEFVLGTTWYASIFLVINAALGAGLLEFPYAFSQSGGITTALVVQTVSANLNLFLLSVRLCCANFENEYIL